MKEIFTYINQLGFNCCKAVAVTILKSAEITATISQVIIDKCAVKHGNKEMTTPDNVPSEQQNVIRCRVINLYTPEPEYSYTPDTNRIGRYYSFLI